VKNIILTTIIFLQGVFQLLAQDIGDYKIFTEITSSNFNRREKRTEYTVQHTLLGQIGYNDSISFHPFRNVTDSALNKISNEVLPLKILTNDSSIYDSIKAGKELRYYYIPTLDLNKLGIWKNHTFYIDYRININCCIIDNIISPNFSHIGTIGIKDTVVFNKPVNLGSCTFELQAENYIFKDSVSIYTPISNFFGLYSYYFVNCNFENYFHFSVYLDQNVEVFLKALKRGKIQEVDFSKCTFNDLELRLYNSFSNIYYEGCSFNRHTVINKFDTSATLVMNDCIINSSIEFINFDRNTILKECAIRDTLNLWNTTLYDDIDLGFQRTQFIKGSVLIIHPNILDIKKLKFNSPSLEKLKIPFMAESQERYFIVQPMISTDDTNQYEFPDMGVRFVESIDEMAFMKSQDFYLRLQRDVSLLFVNQPYVINSLTNRYKHYAVLYEIKYHKDQLKSNFWSNIFPFLWLSLLELIVQNGYNGESNFIYTILIVMLLFGTYFYFKRDEISAIIDEEKFVTDNKRIGLHSKFKDFIKSQWFSFGVLVNPKFSRNFFKAKDWLFVVICLEWALGIFLIIVFLAYVVVNYPFIKMLIGL